MAADTETKAVEFEVLDDYDDELRCLLTADDMVWIDRPDQFNDDDGLGFDMANPVQRQRVRDFANALLGMVDTAEARLSAAVRN